MRGRWTGGLVLLLVAGCARVAPVPPDVFLRLDVAAPAAPVARAWSAAGVRVAPLVASGLHKERPLVFTRDAGSSLQQSHHQLWIDGPERLLQQELVRFLRAARVAAEVDAAPGTASEFVVEGRILRFEQSIDTEGTAMTAVVELALRDRARARVLLGKEYSAVEPIADDSPTAAARAMSRAVATICTAFVADVDTALPPTPVARNISP